MHGLSMEPLSAISVTRDMVSMIKFCHSIATQRGSNMLCIIFTVPIPLHTKIHFKIIAFIFQYTAVFPRDELPVRLGIVVFEDLSFLNSTVLLIICIVISNQIILLNYLKILL